MSYQVLARKWRPRFFREMVGQEHVLQALINALDHNRLHHAYLFTGTRGVGKTTIARILAKCLNCEVGVSSEPCGTCSSCLEIAQGSFVDLIEVDAASRTKVEDTRELLDNVQYAPSKGRFKVYLIDEVHMLSTHSFNALLKTLEEPPEHVKFLLATTDPQKLPPTILSRCLQFNLKNMSPEKIVGHLDNVLTQEAMKFEEPALWSLARSANGSMRDALSLTDQAIAFGTGNISAQAVSSMLGSIDQQTVYNLMQGLINYDAQALMAEVARFSEHAPDYTAVLDELLMLLHRLSLAQVSADCVDNSEGDREKVLGLAGQLSAEELQLFYQMAILGKRDLGLAPDLRTGFEMTLIRLLTFRPAGIKEPMERVLPQPAASAVAASAANTQSTMMNNGSVNGGGEEIGAKKPEQGDRPVKLPELDQSADAEQAIAIGTRPADTQESTSLSSEALPLSSEPVDSVVLSPEASLASVTSELVEDSSAIEGSAKEGLVEASAVDVADTIAEHNDEEHGVENSSLENNSVEKSNVENNAEKNRSASQGDAISTNAGLKQDDGTSDKPHAEQFETAAPVSTPPIANIEAVVSLPKAHEQWLTVFHDLPLQGLIKSIAAECVLTSVEQNEQAVNYHLLLNLSQAQLFNERHQDALQAALQVLSSASLKVFIKPLDAMEFSQAAGGLLTASQNDKRLRLIEQQRVEAHIASDPTLSSIIKAFDAQIVEGSVKTLA